jgi:hypothetical protein
MRICRRDSSSSGLNRLHRCGSDVRVQMELVLGIHDHFVHRLEVDHYAPSVNESPETLCPPPRTATSRPSFRAYARMLATSEVD